MKIRSEVYWTTSFRKQRAKFNEQTREDIMERADDLDKCLKPRAVLTEDQVIEIFRISLVKRSPEIANFTATSVARILST